MEQVELTIKIMMNIMASLLKGKEKELVNINFLAELIIKESGIMIKELDSVLW